MLNNNANVDWREALKCSLKLINDLWKPRVIAELNGQQVKISKVKGEFVWHDHKDEDELFYILKGKMIMMEQITAIKRAGADIIASYFAKDVVKLIS